jgi:hypothetical protein
MALIKGMLISYNDLLLDVVPTIVAFQYNPSEVTRVFTLTEATDSTTGKGRAGADRAVEAYTVHLELDATEALAKDVAPITSLLGIAPQLAAIEMLVQPVSTSGLSGLASEGGSDVPTARFPFVLFAWGPARIVPVRLRSLTIRETSFDELLNPIRATADLGFVVLREADVPCEPLAQAAARYYTGLREANAILQLGQIPELIEDS